MTSLAPAGGGTVWGPIFQPASRILLLFVFIFHLLSQVFQGKSIRATTGDQ
jgi:hypothetical protein